MNSIPTAADCCKQWAAAQEGAGNAWLKSLPDCPCSLAEAKKMKGATPPTKPGQQYHPGCEFEVRIPVASGAGQQCCYDKGGELITNGLGAGTPDKTSPQGWGSYSGHWIDDVDPFHKCGEAGMLHLYFKFRPPNQGKDKNGKPCKKNPPTTR